MPIPKFDHNHVLPPHLGDPSNSSHLSPYDCTILELCQRFSGTSQRILILKNYVAFRQKMTGLGILNGFQWLDGSFTENIEVSEGRPPSDLDVVTFYRGLSHADQVKIIANFPEFADTALSKSNYRLDHYLVDYGFKPDVTVEHTRYWLQLFTHNRLGVWKGVVRVSLNTPKDDQDALNFLNSLKV